MIERWAAVLVVIGVAVATHSARADVAPSPPEACASRALGDRCFDAFGRPGRCVAAPFSGGRCSLTEEGSAAPMASGSAPPVASSSASPAASTAPDGEGPSSSGGCAAATRPPVGAGTWVVSVVPLVGVLLLLVGRRRR